MILGIPFYFFKVRKANKILFLLLFFQVNLFSQIIIRGKVSDQATGKAIPFAAVYALHNRQYTATALDGTFEISLKELPDTLKITYLGYETAYVFLEKNRRKNIDIQLNKKEVRLKEVIIKPGYDPLTEFLKKVIKNAKKHNPQNYTYYKYTSYNKLKTTTNDSSLLQELPYIFLWEVVTEKVHKAPNNEHEKVLATRMSGLKKAAFPISPTDFQSLSFYTASFRLMGYEFISPIGKNALKFYYYEDTDTLFQADGDSIFVISFYPKKVNANLFKGEMRISARELALLSIDAEALFPEESGFFKNIRLKQLHKKIYGFWFPEQLTTDFVLNFPIESSDSTQVDLITSIETLFKETEISDTFPKEKIKRIPPYRIEITDKALQRDTSFWKTFRPYELTEDEKKCYSVMDSAVDADPVARARIYFFLNQTRKLPYGLLQLGKIDINLRRLVRYNFKEGIRPGLALFTNENFSRIFTFGGYFGYGFTDNRSKYAGIISLSPFKNKAIRFHFSYENDLQEFGVFHIYPDRKFLLFQSHLYGRNLQTREFRADRYLYYRQIEGRFFFPIRRSFEMSVGARRFFCSDTLLSGVYDFLVGEFKWAPGQKLMNYKGQAFLKETGNPIFIGRFLGNPQGEFRADVGIQSKFPLKHNLIYSFFLRSGYINFSQPFFFHSFASAGKNAKGKVNAVYADYSFQTMPYNTFLANEYISLYNKMLIDNLSFPNKKYNPDLLFHWNIAYGILERPTNGYKDFKYFPYSEAGITFVHFFPKPFSSFGVSIFYPTSSAYFNLKNWKENIILKIFLSEFGK